MALAAMQPRDVSDHELQRRASAPLSTSQSSPHSATPQLPPPPTAPRLPSLAQLVASEAQPLHRGAPPSQLHALHSLPHIDAPALPALGTRDRAPRRGPQVVVGDALLRAAPAGRFLPSPRALGGFDAARAGRAAAPLGGRPDPRRVSAPGALRGAPPRAALAEKRKSDVVPPAGSNIKEYCAVLTPFIYKLYCLVSDESTNDLCCWSERGDAFLVRDPTAFAATVLPNYFKHNQFSSFVRQLNKYRFHKLAPGAFLFGHDRFIRNRPDLLPDIGRQRSPERAAAAAAVPTPPPRLDVQTAYNKRARIRPRDTSPDRDIVRDPIRTAVAAETASLRADVAALRADNAALIARVGALEDALAATRGAVDYLQHAAQSHAAQSLAARTLASQTHLAPQQLAPRGYGLSSDQYFPRSEQAAYPQSRLHRHLPPPQQQLSPHAPSPHVQHASPQLPSQHPSPHAAGPSGEPR